MPRPMFGSVGRDRHDRPHEHEDEPEREHRHRPPHAGALEHDPGDQARRRRTTGSPNPGSARTRASVRPRGARGRSRRRSARSMRSRRPTRRPSPRSPGRCRPRTARDRTPHPRPRRSGARVAARSSCPRDAPNRGASSRRATAIPAMTMPICPAVRPLSSRNSDRNGKKTAMTIPNRMNSTCTATAGRICERSAATSRNRSSGSELEAQHPGDELAPLAERMALPRVHEPEVFVEVLGSLVAVGQAEDHRPSAQ